MSRVGLVRGLVSGTLSDPKQVTVRARGGLKAGMSWGGSVRKSETDQDKIISRSVKRTRIPRMVRVREMRIDACDNHAQPYEY